MGMDEKEILAELRRLSERVERLEKQLAPAPAQSAAGPASTPAPANVTSIPAPVKAAAPAVPVQESGREQNLELAIGGTWLNRIGIVAFVLGMAFFLKYALDNQWIGPMGRIVIGFLTGLGLLVSGEVFQNKKYRILAQGLTGGGIAVLYFTVYAAFVFYQMIPSGAAFALMILVTAAGAGLALRYNAIAIAILGIIGGYFTPMISGQVGELAVYVYVLVLSLGVLGTAYFKRWSPVVYLSFILTYIDMHTAVSSSAWLFQTFLTLAFAIFVLVSLFYHRPGKEETPWGGVGIVVLNAAFFFGSTFFNLLCYADYFGFLAVGLALIHFLLGRLGLRLNKDDRLLPMAYLGVALTFLTLALPLQLYDLWLTVAWAVEAACLLAAGLKGHNRQVRGFALAALALAVFQLLVVDTQLLGQETGLPFLNGSTAAYLAVIAALFASARMYAVWKTESSGGERSLVAVGVLAGCILLLLLLSLETRRGVEYFLGKAGSIPGNPAELALSLVWGLYSIIMVTLGIIKRYRPVRLMAIVLFGLTIYKVFIVDLAMLGAMYRIISFICLGVLLILVSFLYQRYRHIIEGLVGPDNKKQGV